MTEEYAMFAAVLAVLGQLFVVAFAIERILDFVFDYHYIREFLDTKKGFKALIALIAAVIACIVGEWDLFAVLMASDAHIAGQVLTGMFVASGSGAIMTLFHNVLGLSQSLRRERREALDAERVNQQALREIEIARLEQDRIKIQRETRDTRLLLSGNVPLKSGMSGVEIAELQRLLKRYGYFDGVAEWGLFDESTEVAVKDYQAFMGIKPDGLVGPITKSFFRTKRCGLSDRLPANRALAAVSNCRWETHDLSYRIHRLPPMLGAVRSRQLIKEAFDTWASTCGLSFVEATSDDPAHISVSWERPRYRQVLDEPGVYAYGHMPCHPDYPGEILMDREETWLDDDHSEGADGYYVRLNMIHEIGHAIGLGHSNVEIDIMYSYPQRAGKRGLTTGDVAGAKRLYPENSRIA
uniref:Peptidoglycan binding domain-containing protein n=1 Tax=Candidatus Kentrum sp. LPFa TaxID=2126335 RepID=A0A450X6F9_9GAMM|nr:MAG: Putative peptidoglycan binding domain-containing protein [Candidatus Kentron sp. LPFa]VFK24879.1 MAG: Putative peptidoglycan binding domain-containing protein [Candidatus Kentron sp. LPFa]